MSLASSYTSEFPGMPGSRYWGSKSEIMGQLKHQLQYDVVRTKKGFLETGGASCEKAQLIVENFFKCEKLKFLKSVDQKFPGNRDLLINLRLKLDADRFALIPMKNLVAKIANSTPENLSRLADLLHYSFVKKVGSSYERITIRVSLLQMFNENSSLSEISSKRAEIDSKLS